MSYCRWSSNDFQCDVYVYAHANGGWRIEVAGSRVIWDVDLPPVPEKRLDQAVRFQDVIKMLRDDANFHREPIEHPLAGESYSEPSPRAAADRLEHLKSEGFQVPDSAIEALREQDTTGS